MPWFNVAMLVISLLAVPAKLIAAQSIYRDCDISTTSRSSFICKEEKIESFKTFKIISHHNGGEFVARFDAFGTLSLVQKFGHERVHAFYVQKNGRVMLYGVRDNVTPKYSATLSIIQNIFSKIESREFREKIQRNLHRLQLYNSKVDGIWGVKTAQAIMAYNLIFRKSLGVTNEENGAVLLRSILMHSRFDYLDGKIWSKDVISVVKEACKSSMLTLCTDRASRNLSNQCFLDDRPSACSNSAVCKHATIGAPPRWNRSNITSERWVFEAQRRGLSCGVEPVTVKNNDTKCANNPDKCGAVELCQRGTVASNGKRIWRTDAQGSPYAKAAQNVGLKCNVEGGLKEQIFRVANGTGFFVSKNGDVVTNHHVVNGCNEVQVHSSGNSEAAKVAGTDKINDLALLSVNSPPIAILNLSSKEPYLFQDIYAAGFPFGDSVSSSLKVTKGVVSSLSGLGDNSSQIQIDAALQPGNSGGPIIDEGGNVVAVAVAKLDLKKSIEKFGVVPENVNFGITLSTVKSFLNKNRVNYHIGSDLKMEKPELGELVTDATVLISCWMTEAQIEVMQEQKTMFLPANK